MRDLRRPSSEEGLQPHLGIIVDDGECGHQALGQKSRVRLCARDAGQRLQHRKVAQRRVAGDLLGQFKRLGDPLVIVTYWEKPNGRPSSAL
jgi:hypothetical protein